MIPSSSQEWVGKEGGGGDIVGIFFSTQSVATVVESVTATVVKSVTPSLKELYLNADL